MNRLQPCSSDLDGLSQTVIIEQVFNYLDNRRPAMPTLDEDTAVQLAEVFHLIGDPNRLRIVFACLDEPVCVSDMAARLGLSPSLVSHHLRLLRAARLLGSERRGKQVFYRAADEHIRSVLRDMAEHVEEPAEHPESA
jgi:ArsR family transcriptional regulator, lead/cadmium/zinc/bismuth-responsive transcriptional repressor